MTRLMAILPKTAQIPAPRGPLLSAKQIAEEFFGYREGVENDDARSPKWVLLNIPNKVDLGHSTKRWYRSDVEAFIASKRESAA